MVPAKVLSDHSSMNFQHTVFILSHSEDREWESKQVVRLKCSDNPVPPTPPLHHEGYPGKGCQSEQPSWLSRKLYVVMYSIWVLNLKRVGSPWVLPTRYPQWCQGYLLRWNPRRPLSSGTFHLIVPRKPHHRVWWPWHHFLIETARWAGASPLP